MHNNRSAKYWIDELKLSSHPEGGHYREVYRSGIKLPFSSLPESFINDRHLATSIYFLLQQGEFSAFHRLKSDEVWYYHDGSEVDIFIISQDGRLIKVSLGLDIDGAALPQITIPAYCWFAAKSLGDYTLMSCHVAPGFDFDDFELASRDQLVNEYPHHEEIIKQFTKSG